jgi:hypothetical protein
LFNILKTSVGTALMVLIATVFIAVGCSSSRTVSTPERVTEPESNKIDESFDPVMLQDEDIEFPVSKTPVQSGENLPLEEGSDTQLPVVVENKLIEGFRVQLFATQDIEKATLEKKEAEFSFAEDQIPVYIEFDSPMYKVRIGDCTTRDEAEQLRELARRKGYSTSWIVKTKVNTIPNLPQGEGEDSGGF